MTSKNHDLYPVDAISESARSCHVIVDSNPSNAKIKASALRWFQANGFPNVSPLALRIGDRRGFHVLVSITTEEGAS